LVTHMQIQSVKEPWKNWRSIKAHFRWGPKSKFLGTHLDSFEVNWILEWDPALDPSLPLGSPIMSYLWALFWGLNVWTNWFSLQIGLALICHFLILDPYLKAVGSNLWLSAKRIALFHWTLNLWP
jgi:hypothetical protein